MPIILHQDREILYDLKRTKRRQSIALRVDPSGAVTVLAPRFAVGFFIERFVQKRADWIYEKLKHFEASRTAHPPKAFVDGELFPVWGAQVPLRIIQGPAAGRPGCEQSDGCLRVLIPQRLDSSNSLRVKDLLREWYARQTQNRLLESLPVLAATMSVNPGKVKVANQRKRWGSCSRQGNLRFNWRLSMMPSPVLDYVIVHELAHLKALDHSPRFWSLVQAVLPDFKVRRAWLRDNGAHLDFLNS